MIDDGVRWLCLEMMPSLVYRQMRSGGTGSAATPEGGGANARLMQFRRRVAAATAAPEPAAGARPRRPNRASRRCSAAVTSAPLGRTPAATRRSSTTCSAC